MKFEMKFEINDALRAYVIDIYKRFGEEAMRMSIKMFLTGINSAIGQLVDLGAAAHRDLDELAEEITRAN